MRLTRKTNEKDFVSKESCYYLYEDEDTKEKFLEKYPYAADQWPRWIDNNAYISKLGRLEDLEEKLGYSLELAVERLEKLEKENFELSEKLDVEESWCVMLQNTLSKHKIANSILLDGCYQAGILTLEQCELLKEELKEEE